MGSLNAAYPRVNREARCEQPPAWLLKTKGLFHATVRDACPDGADGIVYTVDKETRCT